MELFDVPIVEGKMKRATLNQHGVALHVLGLILARLSPVHWTGEYDREYSDDREVYYHFFYRVDSSHSQVLGIVIAAHRTTINALFNAQHEGVVSRIVDHLRFLMAMDLYDLMAAHEQLPVRIARAGVLLPTAE